MAALRDQQGRPERVSSPTFLVTSHARAMSDREARGQNVDNKVRIAARKAMRKNVAVDDTA